MSVTISPRLAVLTDPVARLGRAHSRSMQLSGSAELRTLALPVRTLSFTPGV